MRAAQIAAPVAKQLHQVICGYMIAIATILEPF
jgi:hypothetical protein